MRYFFAGKGASLQAHGVLELWGIAQGAKGVMLTSCLPAPDVYRLFAIFFPVPSAVQLRKDDHGNHTAAAGTCRKQDCRW